MSPPVVFAPCGADCTQCHAALIHENPNKRNMLRVPFSARPNVGENVNK